MRTRTRIICTIGPSCNSLERINELVQAGMDVARLNFSHGTHDQHAEVIQRLKQVRNERRVPLSIMLDNKGPEVRLGRLIKEHIQVSAGSELVLVKGEAKRENELPIRPAHILGNLQRGMTVLFNDGYVASTVVDVSDDRVVVVAENGGEIASGKGVNVPDADLDLPALTDRDREDLRFGCRQGIDLLAASFIRTADQVATIKRLLAEEGRLDVPVIAKIENSLGVRNFDSILQAADGIMIARGDLGVEIPLAQVPAQQKMMIRKCYMAAKPSITATQMLESMIERPRPTRAEASDVANAIYDSTSAVMLSGETAVGKYPIRAVEVMRSIVMEAEADFDYRNFFYRDSDRRYQDVPSSVALASLKTAYASDAKAIFVFTTAGGTVRLMSRLRPSMPILALTGSKEVYHRLAFFWGTVPIYAPDVTSHEEAFERVSEFALEHGYVEYGDLVVVTAGVPFGIVGTTNMMMVESIGDVLVRGVQGHGPLVYGPVSVLYTVDEGSIDKARDRIVLLTRCDDTMLPLLKQAKGVILQNGDNDLESEKYLLLVSKALDLPVVLRAEQASKVLREGQTVTIEPERGLIYAGIVNPE